MNEDNTTILDENSSQFLPYRGSGQNMSNINAHINKDRENDFTNIHNN